MFVVVFCPGALEGAPRGSTGFCLRFHCLILRVYQSKSGSKFLLGKKIGKKHMRKLFDLVFINGWERKVDVSPCVDLYSGRIIVLNMSCKFQIVHLHFCDLKLFIMRIYTSYQ